MDVSSPVGSSTAPGAGPHQPPLPERPSRPLSMRALVLALALLLLVLVGAVALIVHALQPDAPERLPPGGKAPAAAAAAAAGRATIPLPTVAPVELLPISADDARAINAAVPFSTQPNPPAPQLHLALAADEQARAVDCLAAAAWYEAGDDAVGEQAVVQVVLNRLRHPVFPHTVCGVVFQGAERTTGCQFSFTCDNALSRTPSPVAWLRAQGIATAALGGLVFAPVGYATHYHTDWVVPNWDMGVDKIAAVHTHLFFRWRGAAGRPGAFTATHQGTEPVIAKLARLSPAHAGAGTPGGAPTLAIPPLQEDTTLAGGPAAVPPPPAPAALRGNGLVRSGPTGLFVIHIAADAAAGSLALVALDLCRARDGQPCTVVGFTGETGTVTSDGVRTRWSDKTPDFFFFSDRSRAREILYWNCTKYPRPAAQCLPEGFVAAG